MANSFSDTVWRKVSASFQKNFIGQIVAAHTVNRQIVKDSSGEFGFDPRSGDTLYVKRPLDTKAILTSDGDISGQSRDLTTATAPVKVQNMITTRLDINTVQQALESGISSAERLDELTKPHAVRLATELERQLTNYMLVNAALVSGTPGTLISKWSDIAKFNTLMESLGVPVADGEAYAMIPPYARQNLADLQSGLASGDNDLVNRAWRNALISKDFGGLRAISSNMCPTYTAGSATDRAGAIATAPIQTYAAVKETMQQQIGLKGLSASSTIKAGETIVVTTANRYRVNPHTQQVVYDETGSPVPYSFSVLEDATTDASGNVTVKVSGAPIWEASTTANSVYNNISAALAVDDVVLILGSANASYQNSLFYHRDAVALGSILLPKIQGWQSSRIILKDHEGKDLNMSVRMTAYSDPEKNINNIRFDLLPAFGILNPSWIGKGYGNV